MKISAAIKKAERVSGEKVKTDYTNQHSVNYKGYNLSFYPNGRMSQDADASCFYTKKNDSIPDDITTDYFGGTFHDNITQAFKFIDRIAN